MRPLTSRIPGSRSLTPKALAFVAAATVVSATAVAWLLSVTRDSTQEMLPTVRLVDSSLAAEVEPSALHAVAEAWIDAARDELIQQTAASTRPAIADLPQAAIQQPASSGASKDKAVMYNGRRLRPARTLSMLVTAYSPDARSCGKWADGKTASGYSVWTNGMKLVAADTSILPFGSVITVPGYNDGKPVPVLDRGGKIKGHRLDVLYPTHEIALKWGAQRLDVVVWEYAD